jgi:hypothetical protein
MFSYVLEREVPEFPLRGIIDRPIVSSPKQDVEDVYEAKLFLDHGNLKAR